MASSREFPLQPAPNSTLITAPDDPSGLSTTSLLVKNLGAGTVYYSSTTQAVSPTVNSGSIASGASATLTPGQYFVADTGTVATVLVTNNVSLTPTVGRPPTRFAHGGGEVVATRPGLAASTAFSSGATNFISNLQSAHKMIRAATTIRLYYVNGHHETDNGNNLSVKAQVSTGAAGAGPFLPVFFNGSRTLLLEPGGAFLSDPVTVDLAAGADLFVHTWQQAGTSQANEKYIINHNTFLTNEFGNNTTSDLTGTQLVAGAVGGLMPSYIVAGQPSVVRTPMIGIYGDSIVDGKGDNNQEGWAARALKGNYGYVGAALSSEKVQDFVSLTNSYHRRARLDGITAAICNYGINDVSLPRTLAQIQGDLASMVAIMRRAGAQKVTWSTLLPLTTSSDTWATAGNQTVGPNEAGRLAFNNWLRTQAGAAVDYVFDAADAVEVNAANVATRNGGFWGAGYAGPTAGGGNSPDGIHPMAAGHAAIVTAFQAFLAANPAALGVS